MLISTIKKVTHIYMTSAIDACRYYTSNNAYTLKHFRNSIQKIHINNSSNNITPATLMIRLTTSRAKRFLETSQRSNMAYGNKHAPSATRYSTLYLLLIAHSWTRVAFFCVLLLHLFTVKTIPLYRVALHIVHRFVCNISLLSFS